MTLTELKYIVAVAREKHFGRAADACYVAQPTLSIGVKKLEEELGVKIFNREGGISLTDAGVVLVEQAVEILEQAKLMKMIAANMGKAIVVAEAIETIN